MQSAILSSWPLFLGIMLFMVGNGLQGVLLGVRAETLGFGSSITGFIMGGYYFGFLFGSFAVPKLVSTVGHIRVFGAMAALASASILVHPLIIDPTIWLLMRILTGIAYVGLYIVAESWINDRATNTTRGAMLSVYMITQMTGLMLGQYMFAFDTGNRFELFLWISVIVSFAAIPIMITAAKAPDFTEPERATIRRVYHTSPLAAFGMVSTGFLNAIVFGMGAVYAAKLGLTNNHISLFMITIVSGALLIQYPIGKLSDIVDRRTIILIAHALSLISALAALLAGLYNNYWILIAVAALYGGVSTPLYSLYIAHANDYLTPKQVVGTSSMLIMISGFGAVLGAPVTGYAMGLFGASAFFALQGIVHGAMILFVIHRMRARQAVPNEAQGTFAALRGTQVASTLLPDAEWNEEEHNDTTTS